MSRRGTGGYTVPRQEVTGGLADVVLLVNGRVMYQGRADVYYTPKSFPHKLSIEFPHLKKSKVRP